MRNYSHEYEYVKFALSAGLLMHNALQQFWTEEFFFLVKATFFECHDTYFNVLLQFIFNTFEVDID